MWRWDNQEPFGNDVPNNNPSGAGAFEFPLRFPGQYFDRETNLAYNAARDYDASIGRYVESDPMGLDGGLDTYAYVYGDPLFGADPLGLLTRPVSGPVRGSDAGAVQGGACGARRRSNGGPPYEHAGVDLLGAAGGPVLAPISGTIEPSGREGVLICAVQGTMCCGNGNKPRLVCYRLVHVTPTIPNGRVKEGDAVATINVLPKPIPPHVHVELYEMTCDGMKRKCPPFN